jgi:hypothetical protein
MPVTIVRTLLNSSFQSFKRSKEDPYPCDYFGELGVFAYYNRNGLLKALEFAMPAEPLLDGIRLLGMGFSAARDILKSIDPNVEEDETGGATSFQAGVGIWAPHTKDDPMDPCESVITFARGYYDDPDT